MMDDFAALRFSIAVWMYSPRYSKREMNEPTVDLKLDIESIASSTASKASSALPAPPPMAKIESKSEEE